ncbi:glycosyltransferase family 4 protein [Nocardioides lianchengensis]|uniref:Phosphatidylinositol alpha 1,6-mannosyltransferase n=1 Tax=Nocardioides lianchengensis TaxID=1045774 RepID=A0A1G6N898_9ACTN|nr:glycosyltransferase family 1 protein [Nocardioides lianchengensis]NYG10692.1 phosphatidylinositol alpha 1,6-mannosyltransferase [Nocardioides lianchengensis]SDC64082.1 phosphatidylinositol alpha 1,6-mannosyltransferase [Nocardioides lianchengensis]
MENLRVLIVSESFLPQVNGVTNSVRRVLEHLAATGHEAELVAPTGPPSYAGFPVTHARGASLPFYRDFRIGLETRRRLRAVMLRFRPDVVHVASPATLGYQATRAAAELGIPTVAIYQTDLVGFAERYGIAGGCRAMAGLTRRIHHRVDLTLAPSSASLRQLDELGVPRTVLWPRGVDLQAFHPVRRSTALRQELAPDGRLLVGYVGRLAPEKELDLLSHLAEDPRYRLVLVGGGPEEQRLRTLLPGAAFLGVLHGDALGAAYASLDVFVHTGRHETYCQSAQEALASGVPVVAPRAGGPVDVVRDGVAGHLYTPGDAAELASYVGRLADDQLYRRRMGLAARRSVNGRSWRSVNDRLVEHYRAVASERVTRLAA